jgi:hypothetical protein|tara:strand:- start:507 stop:1487 length:981 start_codon:yes stop_codon:yes gene_type:complete
MNDFKNKGYIVIKNKQPDTFETLANHFYHENKVDYEALKHFIDNSYFPSLQKNITSVDIVHPRYGKFRFSDNNNSSDAAAFHGDIYNHTDEDIVPVYTCLYYFDDATLEIIPQTHKQSFLHSTSSHASYKSKEQIHIQGGTFIIFNANIHHRGVNFKSKGSRRLLQIFEVTLNDDDYVRYSPKLMIVETQKSLFVQTMTKIAKQLYENREQEMLTYLHYVLVYNNLQYKIGLMIDLSPYEKQGKLVSYEPGKRISVDRCKECQDTNINIICDNNIRSCDPGTYYFYCYILYWILSFVILYLLFKWEKPLKKIAKSVFRKKVFSKNI